MFYIEKVTTQEIASAVIAKLHKQGYQWATGANAKLTYFESRFKNNPNYTYKVNNKSREILIADNSVPGIHPFWEIITAKDFLDNSYQTPIFNPSI